MFFLVISNHPARIERQQEKAPHMPNRLHMAFFPGVNSLDVHPG
jgi:hypothetical protein